MHEDNAEKFITNTQDVFQAMFYKDGKLNPGANGKMIDQRNFQRVKNYLCDASEKGANIVFGGQTDPELLSIHPLIMTDGLHM